MPDWSVINRALRAAGRRVGDDARPRPVGGGDISAAWRLDAADGPVFLKTGPASSYEMFSAEAEGLAELAAADAIRVPEVVAFGVAGDTAYAAFEWLDFGRPGPDTERKLGERLAALHRTTRQRFGWHRDNTIGATPQTNTPSADWIAFWREHRLGYQLALAARNGYAGALQREGARLMERLPGLFVTYTPQPSLLHGDLWSGNAAFDQAGAPVVFDPAVYYGDREADLAMTELFGGFSAEFYAAYRETWPLDAGYAVRRDLYNLYHVLNHLNLFGGGYLSQSERLVGRLLAAA